MSMRVSSRQTLHSLADCFRGKKNRLGEKHQFDYVFELFFTDYHISASTRLLSSAVDGMFLKNIMNVDNLSCTHANMIRKDFSNRIYGVLEFRVK